MPIYISILGKLSKAEIPSYWSTFTCMVNMLLRHGVNMSDIHCLNFNNHTHSFRILSKTNKQLRHCERLSRIPPIQNETHGTAKSLDEFGRLVKLHKNTLIMYDGHGGASSGLSCNLAEGKLMSNVFKELLKSKPKHVHHTYLINACWSNRFASQILVKGFSTNVTMLTSSSPYWDRPTIGGVMFRLFDTVLSQYHKKKGKNPRIWDVYSKVVKVFMDRLEEEAEKKQKAKPAQLQKWKGNYTPERGCCGIFGDNFSLQKASDFFPAFMQGTTKPKAVTEPTKPKTVTEPTKPKTVTEPTATSAATSTSDTTPDIESDSVPTSDMFPLINIGIKYMNGTGIKRLSNKHSTLLFFAAKNKNWTHSVKHGSDKKDVLEINPNKLGMQDLVQGKHSYSFMSDVLNGQKVISVVNNNNLKQDRFYFVPTTSE